MSYATETADLYLKWAAIKPERAATREGSRLLARDKGAAWDAYVARLVRKDSRREFEARVDRQLQRILAEEMSHLPTARKPSRSEWMTFCDRLALRVADETSSRFDSMARQIYVAGLKNVAHEFGLPGGGIQFGGKHEEVLRTVTSGEGLADTFARFSHETSQKLKEIVVESFKEGVNTPGAITTRMNQEVGWQMERRLRVIARTESHKVWEKARTTMYEEMEERRGEKFLYAFGNQEDHKTCKVCQEIIDRTREGLPLEKVRDIIVEVSTRKNPKWEPERDGNFALAHPVCRHSVRRIQPHLNR